MASGKINIPETITDIFPLPNRPKLWYEIENQSDETSTYRFSKRSDHTGILIKIDNAKFLDIL